ncbi:MAG: PHP domain-containing protein [Lentisphaeria bacterium]|nr:PHP domain-containing protein [Lentisphaeria bacterium]
MIDLHMHSSCSDGTLTPEELVAAALALGLEAAALTDHDTVSGVERFVSAASGTPLHAVSGVELASMLFNKDIHIVGLFINPACPALLSALEQMRLWREERNAEMVEKIRSKGYEITMDEVLAEAGGESVGRPHMASVLLKKGCFPDMQSVFGRLIGRNGSCYVLRKYYPVDACIRLIHEAGGLAIWAHPLHAAHGARAALRKIGTRLTSYGLDGLECYYSMFAEQQQTDALDFARARSLLVSGGSDFHGVSHPQVKMGTGIDGNLAIPFEIYERLLAAKQNRDSHDNEKTC